MHLASDDVQYLYAQGKNVRIAKLSDIENVGIRTNGKWSLICKSAHRS